MGFGLETIGSTLSWVLGLLVRSRDFGLASPQNHGSLFHTNLSFHICE
jgi:hypothetical protein